MRLLRLLEGAALCALIVAPARVTAQEAHAGGQGYVYETGIDRVRDGVVDLGNGAAVRAALPEDGVEEGDVAVLVLLESGCRIWIERSGLWSCTIVHAPPRSARRTLSALVWVERIVDGGATISVTGGSLFQVPRQAEFTNSWRPGEAILIEDSRLLHLTYGDELVEVERIR